MELNELQDRLEGLYDVCTPHRVEDFLVHDPAFAGGVPPDPGAEPCPERLLLVQDRDAVDVGLFLDKQVLERLRADNPGEDLHAGNLQDFLFALEGVSHFLYLAWNAAFERPITLFELELQAEVDKFVTTVALLQQQRGRVALRRLWRGLFEDVRLRSDLPAEERHRYREANRLAGHYCARLARLPGLHPGRNDLRAELRRFYRMPRGQKVRHIEALPARA